MSGGHQVHARLDFRTTLGSSDQDQNQNRQLVTSREKLSSSASTVSSTVPAITRRRKSTRRCRFRCLVTHLEGDEKEQGSDMLTVR